MKPENVLPVSTKVGCALTCFYIIDSRYAKPSVHCTYTYVLKCRRVLILLVYTMHDAMREVLGDRGRPSILMKTQAEETLP